MKTFRKVLQKPFEGFLKNLSEGFPKTFRKVFKNLSNQSAARVQAQGRLAPLQAIPETFPAPAAPLCSRAMGVVRRFSGGALNLSKNLRRFLRWRYVWGDVAWPRFTYGQVGYSTRPSRRPCLVMRFQLNWRNSSIRARLNVSIPATIVAAPPKKSKHWCWDCCKHCCKLECPLLQPLLQIRMQM